MNCIFCLSNLFFLLLYGVAPIINTRPKDETVYAGGQVYLSCEVEGNPIPDVNWFRDGKKMPGSLDNNISVQIRGGQGKNRKTTWIMVNIIKANYIGFFSPLRV